MTRPGTVKLASVLPSCPARPRCGSSPVR
jgi:hypothetical protein